MFSRQQMRFRWITLCSIIALLAALLIPVGISAIPQAHAATYRYTFSTFTNSDEFHLYIYQSSDGLTFTKLGRKTIAWPFWHRAPWDCPERDSITSTFMTVGQSPRSSERRDCLTVIKTYTASGLLGLGDTADCRPVRLTAMCRIVPSELKFNGSMATTRW